MCCAATQEPSSPASSASASGLSARARSRPGCTTSARRALLGHRARHLRSRSASPRASCPTRCSAGRTGGARRGRPIRSPSTASRRASTSSAASSRSRCCWSSSGWSIPQLFAWPPFRDLTHLIERIALVAARRRIDVPARDGRDEHLLLVRVPVQLPERALRRRVDRVRRADHAHRSEVAGGAAGAAAPASEPAPPPPVRGGSHAALAPDGDRASPPARCWRRRSARRSRPLSRLAILAPRRAGRRARRACRSTTSRRATSWRRRESDDYRLVVDGAVATPLSLTLADVQALPRCERDASDLVRRGLEHQRRLARGPAPRHARPGRGGARRRACVVYSLQRTAARGRRCVYPNHARDPRTLLALELNGEELAHRPRLAAAPDRPEPAGRAADEVAHADRGAVSTEPDEPRDDPIDRRVFYPLLLVGAGCVPGAFARSVRRTSPRGASRRGSSGRSCCTI